MICYLPQFYCSRSSALDSNGLMLLGLCRSVMSLKTLWKEEGTLWTTMAVISFPSDGLIVWWYFKLITVSCMTV